MMRRKTKDVLTRRPRAADVLPLRLTRLALHPNHLRFPSAVSILLTLAVAAHHVSRPRGSVLYGRSMTFVPQRRGTIGTVGFGSALISHGAPPPTS